MGTKTFNNYEDLLTFTRASKGHALRPVSYGSELVQNNTFDSDLSGWTTGGNVTSAYSSGTAQLTLGGALTSTSGNWFSQSVFEVGKIYFVTFDATYVSGGSLQAGYGFQLEVTATQSGTYSFTVDPTVGAGTQTNRNNITFGGTSGAVWKIDNVSVKEVTFDESNGTLTLFEHLNNIPRVEYDADGNRLGLLVEEARTNYLSNSNFNSNWSTNLSGAVTASQAEGLDKTQSMALLETTGTSSGIYGGSNNRATASASGEKYALSLIAKHVSGGTELRIRLEGAAFSGAVAGIAVDVSDGTFVSNSNVAPDSYSIESYGNGFYKISISATTVASGTVIPVLYGNQAGDADFYIGMAQLEEGSFPTSYIKTTGSTATRSVDIADINTADFGYNSAEGTVVCEFNIKYDNGGSGFPRVWEIANNASSADRINTYISESNGNLAVGINTNSTAQTGFVLKTNTGGLAESTVAMGWARDDFGVSDNGDTALTDSDIDILPTAFSRNRLKIGGSANSTSDNISGHIKSIKYYPRRLTNAQLEDLSS